MTAAAQADEPWPTFGNPFRFTEQGGEAIYRSVCAGCHMPDGRGASGAGTYPSLADDPRLAVPELPDRCGAERPEGHAAIRRGLTNEQVAAVVTYIRSHFGNGFAAALTPADVAAER